MMAQLRPMWAYIENDTIVFKSEGIGEPHLTWRVDESEPTMLRGVIDRAAIEQLVRCHVAEIPSEDAMTHVDDMTPDARWDFRARQLADLMVQAKHNGIDHVAADLHGWCEASRSELLLVAIDLLVDLMGASEVDTSDREVRS